MRLVLAILAAVAGARAQAYVGAVSSATAETGRASVEATDSPFMNPAGLAFLKGYFFSSGISALNDADHDHGQSLALSITDNLPDTVVPTSVAYVQTKEDFSSVESASRDLRLNVGNNLSRHWALGLGFRYLENNLAEAEHFNQLNMNVGTLYSLNSNLGFAAVFENVLGSKSSVPEAYRLASTTGLGFSYIYRSFLRTRVDVVSASNNSWDRPILGMGLESYMNRWLIVRIGAQRRNEEEANAYSFGLGFVGPRFGVHYAYYVSPELESLTRHSVDLAIPIW